MDDINALSLSLVNILEGHVIHLSKIIYNTDNLMYVEWYQINQTNIIWNLQVT